MSHVRQGLQDRGDIPGPVPAHPLPGRPGKHQVRQTWLITVLRCQIYIIRDPDPLLRLFQLGSGFYLNLKKRTDKFLKFSLPFKILR